MGGQSSQQAQTNQTQNTNATTSQNPWAAATPFLQQILGGAGNIPTTTSPLQNQAISGLTGLAQQGNPYAGSIGDYASSLLGGGGALAQNPALSQNLSQLQGTLNPFTNAANLNPYNTPGLGTALNTLGTDITGQINSQFANAGRSLSDSNTQALARGLSQGLASPLLGQYNTNVGNLMNAATGLYGAGNTTAGALQQAQQTFLGNQGQGVNAATAAQTAQQQPYQLMLQAASLQTGIPLQTLQSLAQIGVPIAGLGGTSTQQGTTTGTGNINQVNNMSPAQQAWGWMNAFGNLFKGGGGTPGGTGASSAGY
jgi:hypothetical protein